MVFHRKYSVSVYSFGNQCDVFHIYHIFPPIFECIVLTSSLPNSISHFPPPPCFSSSISNVPVPTLLILPPLSRFHSTSQNSHTQRYHHHTDRRRGRRHSAQFRRSPHQLTPPSRLQSSYRRAATIGRLPWRRGGLFRLGGSQTALCSQPAPRGGHTDPVLGVRNQAGQTECPPPRGEGSGETPLARRGRSEVQHPEPEDAGAAVSPPGDQHRARLDVLTVTRNGAREMIGMQCELNFLTFSVLLHNTG